MERRNHRKLAARAKEAESNKRQDAAAFSRGYKRVVGAKTTAVRGARKDPMMEQEALIRNHWLHLDHSEDGMMALNIDVLEDIIESTGILITDAEAKEALAWMSSNQLGWYNLAQVLKWWRKRAADAKQVMPEPWQQKIQRFHETLLSYRDTIASWRSTLKYRKEFCRREGLIGTTAGQPTSGWACDEGMDRKTLDEKEDGQAVEGKSQEETQVEDQDDDSGPAVAHFATSVAVGHMATNRASAKLEVLGPALDAPGLKTTSGNDAHLEVTAHQLLLEHRMAQPQTYNSKATDAEAHQAEPMQSVAWIDLNASRDVSDAHLDRLIAQLNTFLQSIPRDLTDEWYHSTECKLLVAGHKKPVKFVRLLFYSRHDVVKLFEDDAFPEGLRLSQVGPPHHRIPVRPGQHLTSHTRPHSVADLSRRSVASLFSWRPESTSTTC